MIDLLKFGPLVFARVELRLLRLGGPQLTADSLCCPGEALAWADLLPGAFLFVEISLDLQKLPQQEFVVVIDLSLSLALLETQMGQFLLHCLTRRWDDVSFP